ncbi:FecCD family ABC transporter permease [Pseudooceanicola aestuarii]|uniref:FecCD family ABC transporter permease n=1 Tax=Pseudooceanicola aestuarii TaxID=2697319 RepID=UPI0013CF4F97|nr:iron ABC transporter permease [Pseudooceanicola aestuarii]
MRPPVPPTRTGLRLSVLALILALAGVAALAIGDQPIRPVNVLGALTGLEGTPAVARIIVLDLRLPRIVLALLVGAALAIAGTAMQALMRNPLAEPGILGINSGAALAAMVVIVGLGAVPETALPVLAFAGALAMTLAIYGLAWRSGVTSLRIILIGIGLGSLAGAGATFLSVFGPVAEVQRAMIWLAGSLNDSRWPKVWWLLCTGLPATVMIAALSRDMDLIGLGDDVARGRGQRVQLVQGAIILAVALLAGGAVAAAGPIAFVGLAAPHVARRLVGPGHAALIPGAALAGALLLVLADLLARRAMAPAQLPVGLTTALLGAPFFGYLLWKRRND